MRSDFDPDELLKIDAKLERLATQLVRSADQADDVRQDAWLAAAEGAADRSSSLSGWLQNAVNFRILRHHCNECRRALFEVKAAKKDVTRRTPADIIERNEVRMRLIKAVSVLDTPYRRTITLSFFESLPIAKVAEVMAVPIETVRTRKRRALSLLRRHLDQEFGNREAWAIPLLPGAMGIFTTSTSSSILSKLVNGVFLMSAKVKVALIICFVATIATVVFQFGSDAEDSDLDRPGVQEYSDLNKVGRSGVRKTHDKRTAKRAAKTKSGHEPKDDPSFERSGPRTELTTGRLELTVVYGSSNGPPAKYLPLQIIPFGVVDPFFKEANFRTNENGRLILEAWHAGSCLVRTVVGGNKRLKIKPGETSQEILVIPKGMSITGTVIDDKGVPFPGAEILVGDFWQQSMKTEPLCVSGVDGHFTVPNLGSRSMSLIAARAPGRLPSPLIMISTSKGSKKEITLTLGGPAGRVVLEFVDAKNNPVPFVRCIAGKPSLSQTQLPDGNTAVPFTRTDNTSDEMGHLALESLMPGELPLIMRAANFAAAKKTLTVQAGRTTHHRVVLQPGGSVRGTVRGVDDQPLSAVEVTLGMYGSIDGNYMQTDKLGRFRFDCVAPGTHSMRAEKNKIGKITGTVLVVVGEEATWDCQLDSGVSIVGVVVDEHGNSIGGLSVNANGIQNKKYSGGFTKTDKNGRFKIAHLDNEVVYRIEVRASNGITTIASENGVSPGQNEFRITVPWDALGVATLTGRIVKPDGRPATGANVSAIRQPFVSGGSTGIETADSTGKFQFKKIPPGRYRLSLDLPRFGHQRSQIFTVARDETKDVGDIRFKAPGRLRIEIAGLEEIGDLQLLGRSLDGGSSVSIGLPGLNSLSQPLAAGRYLLVSQSKTVACAMVEVEVVENETTAVKLNAEMGRQFRIQVRSVRGSQRLEGFSYKLKNAAGLVVGKGSRRRYREGPLTMSLTIANSRHLLEIKDESGRIGVLSLDADSRLEHQITLK